MISVKEIADRIEEVIPGIRPVVHHKPFIDLKKAIFEIDRCLIEGIQNYWVIDRFEDWLRQYTKSENVLATSSGTAALHLALLSLGIKPNDQVIIPSTTFAATANAVAYIGAVPYFIDGAPNIDPDHLRNYLTDNFNSRIKAIIVVHLFGIPADIEKICDVAKEFGLYVIEDACQALGTSINGKQVGTFGQVGVFSFNNNKILSCNGGGALVTNDFKTWHEAKRYSVMGRIPHSYLIEHDRMGWNYRINQINAALGLSQTVDFEKTLRKKRNLAQKYRENLGDMVEFVDSNAKCSQNYWLNAILVENRDELLEELHKRGIKARASFTPLHKAPYYQHQNTDYKYVYNIQEPEMPLSEAFFNRCVCLPSGNM